MKSLAQKCLTDIGCVVPGRSVPKYSALAADRVFHTVRTILEQNLACDRFLSEDGNYSSSEARGRTRN